MNYTFERSPVSEVVLGVQYDGRVFSINDEIDIYDKFRQEYPEIDEVPPLPSVIEAIDSPQSQRILNNWASRKHFISSRRDRLIQIQPDRILFNWRNEDQHTDYPRFEAVFGAFLEILSVVEQTGSSKSARNQYEMSYVDHIPLKSFGLESYDVSEIFTVLPPGQSYKNVSLSYSIAHPEIGAVLNSSIKSGLRKDTKERILVLEATCRGYSADIEIEKWFSGAHHLLLDHFYSIISERAKSVWGYKEE